MQIIYPANNISGLLFYYGAFCQSVKATTRCDWSVDENRNLE